MHQGYDLNALLLLLGAIREDRVKGKMSMHRPTECRERSAA
jgi:hypothetical protein